MSGGPEGGAAGVGILVVTHGGLGAALAAATEHVMGAQEHLRVIEIGADDDIEERRREIRAAAEQTDPGGGVVIVTDMFGSTPSNLALSVLQKGRVEMLAGANLPMLIKLASARAEGVPLGEVVAAARAAGRKYLGDPEDLIEGSGG